jgi:hypothetical protein
LKEIAIPTISSYERSRDKRVTIIHTTATSNVKQMPLPEFSTGTSKISYAVSELQL